MVLGDTRVACNPVNEIMTLPAHLQAALIVLFACGSLREQLLVVTRVKSPFSGGPPRLPLFSLDSHPATYSYVLENKYSGRCDHRSLCICTNMENEQLESHRRRDSDMSMISQSAHYRGTLVPTERSSKNISRRP